MIKCLGYDKKRGVRWAIAECKACKRIYEVDPNKLQYRKHCGCMKSGRIINRYRNGYPKLAGVYKDIMNRCYNKKRITYNNYGGRGITVCDEWRSDSNVFCEWALRNGYEVGLSIDRIDNDKGYFPDNCRWASTTMQNRNKSDTKLTLEAAIEIRNSKSTYRELTHKYGVSMGTIWLVKARKIWREGHESRGAS